VTDGCTVPIDNFAISNILMELRGNEIRIAQSCKFRAVWMELFQGGRLSSVGSSEQKAKVATTGRASATLRCLLLTELRRYRHARARTGAGTGRARSARHA
jgi:hypothetical protein